MSCSKSTLEDPNVVSQLECERVISDFISLTDDSGEVFIAADAGTAILGGDYGT